MHAPELVAAIEAPTLAPSSTSRRRAPPGPVALAPPHGAQALDRQVTFPARASAARDDARVPEVIDCWFDSGCMPFAQWGFPTPRAPGRASSARFPADFISEAIDQTRGWFYSLLMISTLVFDDETQKRLGHAASSTRTRTRRASCSATSATRKGRRSRSRRATTRRPTSSSRAGLRESMECTVSAAKGLPRRVVVLDAATRAALGAEVTEDDRGVKPVEVPRLPPAQRVSLEDPATPAPGADAFRWFFYASNPPWNATRHSLSNVRALQKETLIKLRNVYSFFTIYAAIDRFDPYGDPVPMAERRELDRWILGELDTTTDEVTRAMDGFDVYSATVSLVRCVDALSNWYVRRSRSRFWSAGWSTDKRAAFQTLYEVLVRLTHVFAPFTPFASERMFQNLVRAPALATGRDAQDSVHLAAFPVVESSRADAELARKMAAVRELVSLGLQVRTQAKQRVRQPLRTAHVILARRDLEGALKAYEAIIREELNVLDVSFVPASDVRTYVEYSLKPNFRALGQRGLGKEAQRLKTSMAGLSSDAAAHIVTELFAGATVAVDGVDLSRDDVEIAFVTKDGFAAAGDRVGVVVLDSRLDDELLELGTVREVQNRIQGARKRLALDYADRIHVRFRAEDAVAGVIARHEEALSREALALSIARVDEGEGEPLVESIDGHELRLWVTKA
jgi:isoleucyl-tRNA synthetase